MAPRGPSALLATKKASFRKQTCHLAIPPIMKQIADFSKIDLFYLLWVKSGIWVNKRCFGVFWTECEVSDLKQRQRTTAMNPRNKIQSLVLPTDDPGDALDCITEYGPCTCEYSHMCHTAPTAQKYGFSLQPTLHFAFLVRLEPSNSMPAAKWPKARKPRKGAWQALKRVKKTKKIYLFLRRSAIFRSLMRVTTKRHGFLHIRAHLVAKGVLGHMGQIPLLGIVLESAKSKKKTIRRREYQCSKSADCSSTIARSGLRPFVIMSATISAVGHMTILMSPFFTWSQI